MLSIQIIPHIQYVILSFIDKPQYFYLISITQYTSMIKLFVLPRLYKFHIKSCNKVDNTSFLAI